MSPDDELAQLEALLKLGTDEAQPQPSPSAAPEQRANGDARKRLELEARLRRQIEADQLTLQQAEVRRANARYETNPWWE